MKSVADRLSLLALCFPLGGILVGYFAAKALAESGVAPISAFFLGLMILLVCSICGLLSAIVEIRALRHVDGLAVAAILVNGLFVIPTLCMLITSVLVPLFK
jgi:hypothetical protein